MKELSIEEKAKAYDIALDKIKMLLGTGSSCSIEELEHVFPELKESEDERIRQFLIHEVTETSDEIMSYRNINKKAVLAWLEKQGEKEHVIAPKFDIGDTIRNKITNEVFTITDRCISLEYYCDINHSHEIKFSEQDNWELVEQKAADKVEPKFKVGDWIVQGCNILKIRCVGDTYYCFETVGGYVDDMLVSEIDSLYHLWTIQDAKDGDVLSYRDGQWIFIYKEKIDDKSFYYHALYSTVQGLTIVNVGFTLLSNAITPATKEQRDTLMKAMADAGYTFDFEKKELEKIEQKTTYKTKIYDSMDDLIADALIEEIESSELDDRGKYNRIHWIKSHKRNPAWSEEDEVRFESCIKVLQTSDGYDTINTKWLKSFKYRVQPRPKQEWSEEDEYNLAWLVENLAWLVENLYGIEDEDKEYEKKCRKMADWLKSLKDRYTWKPSDEQMENLSRAFNGGSYRTSLLMELYQELKKLRGE